MIKVSEEDNGLGIFPDMTALLDVIFILLVFLLLTANVVPQVLEVALPKEGAEAAVSVEADNQLSITIFFEKDRWGLGDQAFSHWYSLEIALSERISQMESPEIIIAGDKNVPLEKLLKLFSWLQSKNLDAAQIMVEP